MSFIIAILIAVIHVYIFFLESIFWEKKWVRNIFKTSTESANMQKLMAFNQGFYNLFIALAIIVGLSLQWTEFAVQGRVLVDYGVVSVMGAGFVLLYSEPKMKLAAMIQSGPAIIYFISYYLFSF